MGKNGEAEIYVCMSYGIRKHLFFASPAPLQRRERENIIGVFASSIRLLIYSLRIYRSRSSGCSGITIGAINSNFKSQSARCSRAAALSGYRKFFVPSHSSVIAYRLYSADLRERLTDVDVFDLRTHKQMNRLGSMYISS